ncbi:CBS domain-containing protein [soil metagenome]
MSITVGSILERKGSDAFTVTPQALVADAVRVLGDHDIGVVVVSRTGDDVAGIVSERDIVRRLAVDGPSCLQQAVAEIMTTPVTTCRRDQTTAELMTVMTTERIRHVPVVEDDRMVGLVSIRDAVESYVRELEVTTGALEDYVSGSSY